MRRNKPIPTDSEFHLRGASHVSRLECFSDCVFAFALTLLVVSLEVPKNYSELLVAMKGLVAFAFCFFVLYSLWSRHHVFFRRYGLEDSVTKGLTAVLLFIVLAYVYPLKFLSLVVVNAGLGFDPKAGNAMFDAANSAAEVRGLFVLYGAGLIAMSVVFYLLYRYAYTKRKELKLTPVEEFDTLSYARENLMQAVVPAFVTVMAFVLPEQYTGFAGFFYCTYAIAGFGHGRMHRRGRARVLESVKLAN